MSQLSILKSIALDSSAGVPPPVARASRPRRLFLLLRRGFLPRGFLGSGLLLGMSLGSLNFDFVLVLFRCGLLHLRLLLFQLRGLKALPVKSNLRDAHSAERLPVPAQLLILLLALVVENQNLRSAAFFHEFADDPRSRFWLSDLTFSTRHSQYLRELHLAIGACGQLLHSNHIPGRHPVLLPAGADNRVHTFASVKISLKASVLRNPAHTGATLMPAELPCLLCFPPRRFSSQGRRPQNGSASTVKLSYSSVRCGNRSMRTLRIAGGCARMPAILRQLQGGFQE